MVGTLLVTDRQHTTGENKNLCVRKVNLTWQQSTKVISEHIHRQGKCLELEEVTPNRKEDHCTAFHTCRDVLERRHYSRYAVSS